MQTMLRVGREREEVAVVDDQWGCPTHAVDLARSLATITCAMETGTQPSGIWHIANAGSTSWFGFAQRIFEAATQHGRQAPALRPISTAEYPTPAPRPGNSKLSTAKAAADFDLRLRPWEEASDEAVGEICAAEGN